jgi:acyl carrier protein
MPGEGLEKSHVQELDEHFATLIHEIDELIADNLLVEVGSPEDDLLATGVLDSLTLIQLLTNLEEHFGIRIPLEKLQIEDVSSVSSLARLVERHKCVHASASGGS